MTTSKSVKGDPGIKLMPVNELIAVHMERHEIPNTTVAHRLGYASPNVVAMLRAGTMKLPMNKIVPMARVLHIDPMYLAMCVNAENSFNLDELIEAISRRTPVTQNEEKLILALRKASKGRDIDLDEHPDVQAKIISAFAAAADSQADDDDGLIRALKGKRRSALSNDFKTRSASEAQ